MYVADLISSTPSDTPAVLTLFGVVVAGFFAISRIMLRQSSRDRDADRKERKEFISAIRSMSKSSSRVASATEKSAKEAKERNGHLGEQSALIAKMLETQNKDIHDISTTMRSSVVTLAKDTKAAAIHVAEVKDDLENNK